MLGTGVELLTPHWDEGGKKRSKWSVESHGTERMKRFSLSVSLLPATIGIRIASNAVCCCCWSKADTSEGEPLSFCSWPVERKWSPTKSGLPSHSLLLFLLLCEHMAHKYIAMRCHYCVDQYHMLFITVLQTHTQTAMWPVLDCVSWQALTPDLITHVKWTIKSKSETWVSGKRGGLDPGDTLRHTNISSDPFCSAGQALVNSWKNCVTCETLTRTKTFRRWFPPCLEQQWGKISWISIACPSSFAAGKSPSEPRNCGLVSLSLSSLQETFPLFWKT